MVINRRLDITVEKLIEIAWNNAVHFFLFAAERKYSIKTYCTGITK